MKKRTVIFITAYLFLLLLSTTEGGVMFAYKDFNNYESKQYFQLKDFEERLMDLEAEAKQIERELVSYGKAHEVYKKELVEIGDLISLINEKILDFEIMNEAYSSSIVVDIELCLIELKIKMEALKDKSIQDYEIYLLLEEVLYEKQK